MPTPMQTAFSHRCPACGEGEMYAGILKIVPNCAHCGQHLADEDSGDGPAFFVILIVGFLVTALAGISEVLFSPPLWVHALIWIPVTLASSIWLLRIFKSYLVGLQFQTGRMKDPS